MNSHISTVAFSGIDAIAVDVQVQILNGLPSFSIVGLPAKSVAESRDRIRASLYSIGLAIPAKRIIVNLSPADLQKEGSHFDLPITIALLVSMGVIQQEYVDGYIALGELSLDGSIKNVSGILPASVLAKATQKGIICSQESVKEAIWAGHNAIIASNDILELINHINGKQFIEPIETVPQICESHSDMLCMSSVKGQKLAKRAIEIAAAGGHNVLMSGPPGVGKSLIAERVNSILPPLNPEEALEVTMIYSLINQLPESGIVTQRPYRAPHHSASLPALVGGGMKAQPGEISLAHRGVLFLDELPEFSRQALEALRQPLETGQVTVARVNSHVTYPAKIQLIAAMNPCKCGYLGVQKKECKKAPICGNEYMQRLSGPLLDRFDIMVQAENVDYKFFSDQSENETSESIRKRVIEARERQLERYKTHECIYTNSEIIGEKLEKYVQDDARRLLLQCVDRYDISARGFYKLVKVAMSIADLSQQESISAEHISEAIIFKHGRC